MHILFAGDLCKYKTLPTQMRSSPMNPIQSKPSKVIQSHQSPHTLLPASLNLFRHPPGRYTISCLAPTPAGPIFSLLAPSRSLTSLSFCAITQQQQNVAATQSSPIPPSMPYRRRMRMRFTQGSRHSKPQGPQAVVAMQRVLGVMNGSRLVGSVALRRYAVRESMIQGAQTDNRMSGRESAGW